MQPSSTRTSPARRARSIPPATLHARHQPVAKGEDRQGRAPCLQGGDPRRQRINRALNRIETDMEPLAAPSDPGATARREALMELRGWRLANRLEIKVTRRILRGERFNVKRALRRPNKIMRRVYGNGRRAVRNFAAVGLTSPVGAVSAK
jgi:pyridoxal biosynthesis lyase PdxS